MVATIIEIALVTLVLIGIVKEEKLIAFEDKILDKAAESIAKIIVARRRKQLEAERNERAQHTAEIRRSKMHLVETAPATNDYDLSLFIA